MKRRSLATLTTVRIAALSLALLSLLLLAPFGRFSSSAISVVPAPGAAKVSKQLSPTVVQAAGFAESVPVRDLEPVKLTAAEAQRLKGLSEERKMNETNEVPLKQSVAPIIGARTSDDALQSGELVSANIPAPTTTFDGLANSDNIALFGGGGVLPSDDNIDVGPNHIVQIVNLAFRVYNKSGTPLTPAAKISSLFAPLGSACGARDDGDPIVLYDPLADRWLIAQFCLLFSPNMHQMIAISKTGDPTGQYYLYDFMMPNNKFHDYPHYAVWPDGYYLTTNQFNQAGTQFQGGGAFAFDRNRMLQGDPTASYIYFDEFFIDPSLGGELATDIDGVVPPPVGTPNLFMEFRATALGDPNDALRMFEFHADFANPSNSTFTQKPDLPLATFDASQPSGNPIEQPPPATSSSFLAALADRMMHRIAYRTLAGGVESYVLNFTVNVSGVAATSASTYQAGIRWVELRRNAGTGAMTVNQQGTYAPGAGDGVSGRNSWMASIAQDYQGDIGLGFSTSSLSLFPTISYAGRLAGDPLGTMAQGEGTLFSGSGSQQSGFGRWGDYSAMAVDPSDECTFWYSNQYLNISANNPWRTRIGAFKVDPNCAAQQKATITGQITNCQTGAAVAGAAVATPDGFFRQTDSNGNYSISVAPGTYTLNVSKPGAGFNTCGGSVSVTAGATFNCCLQASPLIVSSGASIVSENCLPANGVIDPGERVTVSFCVKNIGGLNTTNLVGTLQTTGGVSTPSGSATYGIVAAGGASVCQNFTFTASGTCGGTLTASIQFQDGSKDLGTITYTFTLGTTKAVFTENFDGVTAPALPAGWLAANVAGPNPLWVTSINGPDSAPNAAFIDCPSVISDKRLDSPAIAVSSTLAQLTFRQNFRFTDSGSGFDGGVLEISSPNINAGAFTDILAAAVGGSFVLNGYNSIIDSGFGNPLAGRRAWSGNSVGYITTKVNLGPNVAGQSIKLRWRMGSDTGGPDIGWFVDTIVITDGYVCCTCPITCPANVTKSADPNQCGAVVTFATPTASCGSVTCSPTSGSTFPKGTTTVSCTTPAGPPCTFTVTIQDAQPPAITCPANVTVPSNCGPMTVNYATPTVSDNCSGVGAAACTPASGSTFPVGTTTINCNVKDSSNNPASCSFTVTVTGGDTQPPTFPNDCRAPVNVAAAFSCPYATSTQVSYTNPVVSDNCVGVSVACNPPSGSTFPVGSSTVTCTATDASNNTATCTFPVTVYSACLVDDTTPGNVVLFNAATGAYRFCCNGVVIASGKGAVTATGCDVTIDSTKGNRKVHIAVSSAGQGSGSASVQKGTNQVCAITDTQMVGNACACQ